MFGADEVSFFDNLLTGFFDGSLEDNYWFVATNAEDEIIGASYVAPEPFGDRVWNLYFISVLPEHQVRGIGSSMIRSIEDMLRSLGQERARILIVETSSTDQYAGTRAFYRRLGFTEEARISEFYGPSDDKVTFWKSLLGVS
jgi:ribosomal protein S18 acetylase RimI-like enzyme